MRNCRFSEKTLIGYTKHVVDDDPSETEEFGKNCGGDGEGVCMCVCWERA